MKSIATLQDNEIKYENKGNSVSTFLEEGNRLTLPNFKYQGQIVQNTEVTLKMFHLTDC